MNWSTAYSSATNTWEFYITGNFIYIYIKFVADGQAKEYNTQLWFGTWGVDVDLSNHIKNKFANSLSYLFTLSILIILFVIVFILINLHYLLILVILLIHFFLGIIVVLILKQDNRFPFFFLKYLNLNNVLWKERA